MKKRIITLALATLTLGMVACNNSQSATEAKDTTGAIEAAAVEEDNAILRPDINNIFGEWELVKVGQDSVTAEIKATLNLSAEESAFNAHISNNFSGKWAQIERRPDAIRFENVIRTQMMGSDEEMKIEDNFAKLINDVRTFTSTNTKLFLIDENENILIEARRIK